MSGKGNPMGKNWDKNLTELEAPDTTHLPIQNYPKRDSTLTLIRADTYPDEVLQLPIGGCGVSISVALDERDLRSLQEILTEWLYGVEGDHA